MEREREVELVGGEIYAVEEDDTLHVVFPHIHFVFKSIIVLIAEDGQELDIWSPDDVDGAEFNYEEN